MPKQLIIHKGYAKVVSLAGAKASMSAHAMAVCHRYIVGPDTAALRPGLLDLVGAQAALAAAGILHNDTRLSNTLLTNAESVEELVAGKAHGALTGPRFALIDFASSEFTGVGDGPSSRLGGFPTCSHPVDSVAFPFRAKAPGAAAAAGVGALLVHLLSGTEASTLGGAFLTRDLLAGPNRFHPQHLQTKFAVAARFGGVRPDGKSVHDDVAFGVLMASPLLLSNWASMEALARDCPCPPT